MDDIFGYVSDVEPPKFDLPQNEFVLGLEEPVHDKLLSYLMSRMEDGQQCRQDRIMRFGDTDKIVSTWQQLTPEDSQRKNKQALTGQSQAIHINLPLTTTHLDDMVSFLAEVYAPADGAFAEEPEPNTKEESKTLVKKLNTDAKTHKYYANLTKTLRAILKYNIGGFEVQFIRVESDATKSGNANISLDMYNTHWDPAITNPVDVSGRAEWVAFTDTLTYREAIEKQLSEEYVGVGDVLNDVISQGEAKYFKYPPIFAGIESQDRKTAPGRGQNINWANWGASLKSDSVVRIVGFERIRMYVHLNPRQMGLDPKGSNEGDRFELWYFEILACKRIVRAEKVNAERETQLMPGQKETIPVFLAYLNVDDMGDATRSVAELLTPFQTFGSFLMNAHINVVRGNLYGWKGYDPAMFDISAAQAGDAVGLLKSKIPGRDVQTGIKSLTTTGDAGEPLQNLTSLLSIVQQFFPSQALPSQIAGMDRAVTSQVAAVMQGVNRRLHMLVRQLDDNLMMSMLKQDYQNLVDYGSLQLSNLNDSDVMRILGTGLKQLNREAAEQAFRQFIFALIQNPETAKNVDLIQGFDMWAQLMGLNVNMSQLQPKGQPAGAAPPQPGVNPNVLPAGGAVPGI